MDVVVLFDFRNRDLVLAVVAGVVLAASEFLYTAHLPPAVLTYPRPVAAMELAVSAAEPRIAQLRIDGELSQFLEFNVPDTDHECSVEPLPLAFSWGSFA